ncbi:MAG: hypothetical protein NG740_07755, partial [Omnitrophica bacterium]|nr:hypothetical protein [Candidatus Omnitrophota bacterium]
MHKKAWGKRGKNSLHKKAQNSAFSEREFTRISYQLSSFHKTRLCKTIAWTLIFAFILYDITWAQGGTPIWQNAKAPLNLTGKPTIDGINIPYDAGEVSEAYDASVIPAKAGIQGMDSRFRGNDESIINIQDAHTSLTAQYSIVKLLQNLSINYDLDLIALEGAEGPIDISLLRTFPDPKIRKETAEYLMRKGKMSAGEFFSIVSEKPIKLYGVENSELYNQNLEAFKDVMGKKLESIKNTDSVLNTLKKLEDKIYSESLKKLNNNTVLHREGKLAFTEHWDFISKLARKNNIELVIFENLTKLLKTIELEKTINFRLANQERKFLIDELSKTIPKRELEKLVLESLAFKQEKISQGGFHNYLIRLAEDSKTDPTPYPNLINFTNYITIYEDIDMLKLFKEVEELEDYIREKIFRDEEERTLYNLTKMTRTLKKLFKASLTNADYDFIITKKKYFDRTLLGDFIRTSYQKYKLPVEGPYDLGIIFGNMEEAISFYNIAQSRNNAMVQNTIKAMRQNKEKIAALITGGFHSKGLASLMKEKGLSYLIIMPKFKEGEERPYITILTNKRQPYEELLEAGEYVLAFRSYCWTGNWADLMDFLFVSLGQVKGPLEPVLIEYYGLFKAEYEKHTDRITLWAGPHKRPFTPEDFRMLFGVVEHDDGTIAIEQYEGVVKREVRVDDKEYVVLRKYKSGKITL